LQGVPQAERRQNALQAKKRDIFPAGKVWFSPADISAQRKFVIWLANKVRETNLFSSFGYGENSRPWANTDVKYQ